MPPEDCKQQWRYTCRAFRYC